MRWPTTPLKGIAPMPALTRGRTIEPAATLRVQRLERPRTAAGGRFVQICPRISPGSRCAIAIVTVAGADRANRKVVPGGARLALRAALLATRKRLLVILTLLSAGSGSACSSGGSAGSGLGGSSWTEKPVLPTS